MTLTKEDYMRLPKERLAELLVERDAVAAPVVSPIVVPPYYPRTYPWWNDAVYCNQTTADNPADK